MVVSSGTVVGGEKYHWKQGEGVVFDDMFTLRVNKPTGKRRVTPCEVSQSEDKPNGQCSSVQHNSEPAKSLGRALGPLIMTTRLAYLKRTPGEKEGRAQPYTPPPRGLTEWQM